ncbi:MAG TPA: adenylate/guanylate cyclase domain-containing protein [Burkholderiaceae bacterium]|nr:adenylate/guanylate cyclase domain-containing protein [Burkholderiaceae bacterium]
MNNAPSSLPQWNRTFIGSVLFIDIVGYSRRTVPDQLAMKEVFNVLIAAAVQNVVTSERIMVDTGDGAGIAFLGDPEDALFAALSLRDAIDSGKATMGDPGFVRMGINLGPLKMVRDINGHANMIGDGVNDAQRVMSFAEPGQVMVSHSYYDIISRFSRDYSKLFVYEGKRHDKHVREHEVYRFGPTEGAEKLSETLTEKMRDRSRARPPGGAGIIWPKLWTSSTAPAAPPSPRPEPYKFNAAASAVASAAALRKKLAPHTGLIMTAAGAIVLTGAVWSWTGTPDTTPPGSASSPAAGIAATLEKTSHSAAKPRAVSGAEALLAKNPADKSDKKDDEATSAVKPGTLKLAVQPWGEIYVNGSRRGVTPPLKSLSLAPGKHRIEIRNGQFAPYKQTVEVKSNVETTVHYVF